MGYTKDHLFNHFNLDENLEYTTGNEALLQTADGKKTVYVKFTLLSDRFFILTQD